MNHLVLPLTLIGCFLVPALVIWLVNWLAMIPWRRSQGRHWTERARLLWPVRISSALGVWLLTCGICIAGQELWSEMADHWFSTALATLIGATAGTYGLVREIMPGLSLKEWFAEQFTTLLLQFSWGMVFWLAIYWMPATMNLQGLLIALATVTIHVWLLLGGSLFLASQLGRLVPAPLSLVNLATSMSTQMRVPLRGVWLLRNSMANAVALPLTRELIFTGRAVETMTFEQLSAVCAHELGHLAEPRPVVLLRVLNSATWLPWIFLTPIITAYRFPGLLGLFAGWLVLKLGFRWFSRRMELRADAMAREHELKKGAYALALLRLHEVNLIPAVLAGKNNTHPHLYDRLLAAGVTPDFSRPRPPAWLTWHMILFLVLLGVALGFKAAVEAPARPEGMDRVNALDPGR